jgi:acetolactate synthase-1/3 small subunit
VDLTHRTYTLEVTGDEDKIRAMLELLRPFGIKELVRTGQIAIGRVSKAGPVKLPRAAGNGEEVETSTAEAT